jgi:hypothetical protein
MKIRPKQSYHPFVAVAFYLHMLPEKLLRRLGSCPTNQLL